MMPPTKDQADIGYENQVLDASQGDTTHQEFKHETDINYMLSRFGITQPRGAPTYGTWDDTLDLQQAIASVREARTGYNRLPQVLKDKFPSMEAMLRAVENGSLAIKDEEAPEPVKSPMDLANERIAKLETDLKAAAARA